MGQLWLYSLFWQSAFLPQGYPESVSKDYLEYQIWDTSQVSRYMFTGVMDGPLVCGYNKLKFEHTGLVYLCVLNWMGFGIVRATGTNLAQAALEPTHLRKRQINLASVFKFQFTCKYILVFQLIKIPIHSLLTAIKLPLPTISRTIPLFSTRGEY